jgi:hypothetical protein
MKRFLTMWGRRKMDELCELDIIAQGRSLSNDERLRKEEIVRDWRGLLSSKK